MNIAICGIIKDEHKFLREWIEYHLSIGFNSIHLFEDFGSKSHENITKDFELVYLIPLENNKLGITNKHSSKTQYQVYKYFAENTDCDWVLFTDVDEFLMFDKNYNLDKLLEEFKEYPAIWLCWKMYGANNHIISPDGGVLKNYTKPTEDSIELRCDAYKKWNFKSFVNIPKYIGWETIHEAIGGVFTDFTNSTSQGSLIYIKAWLNHYYSKSWEDYCYRIFDRGNMSNNYRTLDTFFKTNPDMLPLKEKLIMEQRYRHSKDTMWLSKDLKLISGGNINHIKELENGK